MKLIALTLTTLTLMMSAGAEQPGANLKRYYRSPEVDAYLEASQNKQPEIPGLGNVSNVLSVSVASTDIAVAAFWVYAVIRLEDGSQATFQKVASFYGSSRNVATVQWKLASRPVEVLKFHVSQLRATTESLVEIR